MLEGEHSQDTNHIVAALHFHFDRCSVKPGNLKSLLYSPFCEWISGFAALNRPQAQTRRAHISNGLNRHSVVHTHEVSLLDAADLDFSACVESPGLLSDMDESSRVTAATSAIRQRCSFKFRPDPCRARRLETKLKI